MIYSQVRRVTDDASVAATDSQAIANAVMFANDAGWCGADFGVSDWVTLSRRDSYGVPVGDRTQARAIGYAHEDGTTWVRVVIDLGVDWLPEVTVAVFPLPQWDDNLADSGAQDLLMRLDGISQIVDWR